MKNKAVPFALVTFMLAVTLILSASQANAQGRRENHADIIKKLTERFNLKQSDVDKVFEEARTERQNMMQKSFEDKVTQYAKDGSITEEQKQSIIQKHTEMRQTYNTDSFRSLTPQQRRDEMAAKRQELEQWAESQGIDKKYVLPMGNKMKDNNKMYRGGDGMQQ